MERSRPLTDSALNVPPQFWRDGGHSQQQWLEAIEKYRIIRGNVIADAYDVENKLGRLLIEIFYPTIPWQPSHDPDIYEMHYRLRNAFGPTFIQTARFADKIRILRFAATKLMEVRKACPKGLVTDLDQVRVLRNRFAHDPIEFEFTPPPESQLRAFLVGHAYSHEVSSEYVLLNWQLCIRCSSALGDLLRAMEARFDRFARPPD
jgi:hypothetical protein